MVCQQGQYYGRSTNSSYSTKTSDLYRFQHDRLGKDFHGSGEKGRLVTPGEYLPHQFIGIVVGGVEGTSVFCTGSGGVSGDGSVRLYDHSGIHLQARWNQIQEVDVGDSGPLQLVGGTPDHPKVQASTLADSLSHGMVNPSQSAGVHIASVGEATSRPLCHHVQPQVANLRLTSSRHHGRGD